ncbi:putative dimethyladenosine transferase [Dorcoceras hygrometricum]|uniref:Putative dimethyladenosine transferase n=1 Tax=Dorcoceras hygrometricum TaxID=472368 RepID=A0A2Z7AHB6_9LAMI|nr:putative dimethyladenosine transferase [Dorcoceras hygrometricum]
MMKIQQMKRSARGSDVVTSSSRKNQQVACIPVARGSDVVEEIQSQATVHSADAIWRLAIAKRCRLHKLIRQRFAIAIKIQQEDFALLFQQTKLQCIQSQRKDIQSQEDSGEAFVGPDASTVSSRKKSRRKELKKEQSAAVVVLNQQRSS